MTGKFNKEKAFAADVAHYFGDYQGTFTSEHGQVRADLFSSEGGLVAYISFDTGLDKAMVTDRYVSELRQIAETLQFQNKFRLIFT
jgi:hypothetical protein